MNKENDRRIFYRDTISESEMRPDDLKAYFNEVENTLKYVLRINTICPVKDPPPEETDNTIDEADQYAKESCAFLFPTGLGVNFFGDYKAAASPGDGTTGDARCDRYVNVYSNHDLWKSFFLEDALYSVYSLLREQICGGNYLKGYSAFLWSHYCPECSTPITTGLDYLIKGSSENSLFSIDGFLLKERTQRPEKTQRPEWAGSDNLKGYGTSYARRLLRIDDLLGEFPNYIQITNNKKKLNSTRSEYNIRASRLFEGAYLADKLYALKWIVEYNDNPEKKKNPARLRTAFRILKAPGKYYTESDKYYHIQAIDRLLHADVIETVWMNIERIRQEEGLNLLIYLETLSLCSLLPSTLSRKYIVQYAFDCFSCNRMIQTEDFFNGLRKSDAVMREMEADDRNRHLEMWLNQYRHMIYYLAKFAFPVYRSCFLISLYHLVENKLNEKGLNGKDSFTAVLTEMYRLVQNAISQNVSFCTSTENVSDDTGAEKEKRIVSDTRMDCSIGFSPTEKILARLIKENSVNSTETGKLPLDQYGDVMEHWFYFRKHDRPLQRFVTLRCLDAFTKKSSEYDFLYSDASNDEQYHGRISDPSFIRKARIRFMYEAADYNSKTDRD